MTTAHPKVRIQYLRDSQAVYTANGAEGLRYATSGSVGLDLRACLEEDDAAIPAGDAFTLNFGSKTFTLADANPGSAAIQYNNGKFNGFFYVSDFLWSGAWYQLNIQGGSLSVYALDGQKNPILGKSYVNGYVNIGNTGLTNQQPYDIPSAGVPEPGTWAMMLIGFFGAGFAVRRGRRALVLARA